jgi:hypothetical protein
MRNECPNKGAGDCRFEILCQPSTATEPRESTTHLRGLTSKPLAVSERSMISIVHSPIWRSQG